MILNAHPHTNHSQSDLNFVSRLAVAKWPCHPCSRNGFEKNFLDEYIAGHAEKNCQIEQILVFIKFIRKWNKWHFKSNDQVVLQSLFFLNFKSKIHIQLNYLPLYYKKNCNFIANRSVSAHFTKKYEIINKMIFNLFVMIFYKKKEFTIEPFSKIFKSSFSKIINILLMH